ncbi:winged helix-turn-helix transcriptional regulator [Corynebacterium uropygiale]|uniref:winged helix-turn-helix transcriptional regulator n=1 Tax=Corynebacterium uropygiale TaxID=1775911 RepID=UPI003B82EEB6
MRTSPRRFSGLKSSIGSISAKVLTSNLRSMEEDGLLTRHYYPEVPPRVEYELTELGQSLRPIIDQMARWGRSNQELGSTQPPRREDSQLGG